MEKRRRHSYDPLASQPRSQRRPGGFNEQAEASPDPNVQFLPAQSSAVGGDPTEGLLRLFHALRRRLHKRRGGGHGLR